MNDKELQQVTPAAEAPVEQKGEIEIDLLELFYRLLENAKRIIAGALVGMLLMALYSFVLATPMYEATSRIYVTNPHNDAATTVAVSDFQIGNYLASDYQEVFESWEIHDAVIKNLGLDYKLEEIEGMLEIENPDDTRILNMTVTSDDPQEAVDIANEYAKVARSYISKTMDTGEPTLLSSALLPERPVRPRKLLYTALGFILGGMIMAGVVTVQFMMDDKIKTSDDLRKYLDMPSLAVIPTNLAEAKAERAPASGKKRRRKSA